MVHSSMLTSDIESLVEAFPVGIAMRGTQGQEAIHFREAHCFEIELSFLGQEISHPS